MTYELSPQLDQRIRSQIALGGYQSPNEVISDALDALEQRNADWQSIRVGIEDEQAGRLKSLDEVDRGMRAKYGLAPRDEAPVDLTDEAERNLHSAYDWYAERSPAAAERWLTGIRQALASLATNPERCSLANENERAPIELRQLNYGSGRRITHRIVFAIRPTQVVVYAIRHVAQQDWDMGGG